MLSIINFLKEEDDGVDSTTPQPYQRQYLSTDLSNGNKVKFTLPANETISQQERSDVLDTNFPQGNQFNFLSTINNLTKPLNKYLKPTEYSSMSLGIRG